MKVLKIYLAISQAIPYALFKMNDKPTTATAAPGWAVKPHIILSLDPSWKRWGVMLDNEPTHWFTTLTAAERYASERTQYLVEYGSRF